MGKTKKSVKVAEESKKAYSKVILTEVLRYSNPCLVKVQYWVGMNHVDNLGTGTNIEEATDKAIERVKKLMEEIHGEI